MKVYLLLIIAFFCVATLAQFSPPKRPYGHSLYKGGLVTFEFFYSYQCPHAAHSFQNTLKKLSAYYGSNLTLTVIPFSLYFHLSDFYATLSIEAAVSITKENMFWQYLDAVFNSQAKFTNAVTADMTRNQIYDLFFSILGPIGGFSKQQFNAAVSDANVVVAVGHGFDYASAKRGIWLSPSYSVNGVQVVQADSTWDFDAWRKFLDPLLA